MSNQIHGSDDAKSYLGPILIDDIKPSPENDTIYGVVVRDKPMEILMDSIKECGLLEPIVISTDDYILSGHRRWWACKWLSMEKVTVRRMDITRSNHQDFHNLLVAFNPQREKTAAVILREVMLRGFAKDDDEDGEDILDEINESAMDRGDSDKQHLAFQLVEGSKHVPPVSEKKREFLEAAKKVIDDLTAFHPLSVRQIHYRLLNAPPLTSTPKRSKYPINHYRYRNDKTSYDALVDLLRQARYTGEISMSVIDDATRPRIVPESWSTLTEFIQESVGQFLTQYERSPQLDQKRHIEVLGEKNTLMQIVKPICQKYYVPLTLGRGYGSIPIWRDMAARFKESGKESFTLLVASDYDPEGFDLADDAVRTLRDCFSIDADYQRVGVNLEQINELGLESDFNPAKETSSRLDGFIERTGATDTWELEALPPEFLQDRLEEAILENMSMDIFEMSNHQLQRDTEELRKLKQQIGLSLGLD